MRRQVISLLQAEIPSWLQSKLVYTFPPPNLFHYHLCKRNQGKIILITQLDYQSHNSPLFLALTIITFLKSILSLLKESRVELIGNLPKTPQGA